MRCLAWTMLMATAFGAGAAGLSGEFNPVLRQPHHASVENATGRVIVKFRPANSSPQRAKLRSTQDRISALMARTGLKLRAVRSVTDLLHGIRVEPAVAGEPIAATVQRLQADPEVEYAEAEQWRYPHATTPDDPVFSQQWYLQGSSATTPSAVDAVTAWDTTTGSTGLVIADLDTGVRFEHPDLQWAGSGGRLLPGYTFISDAFVANDGDARDADASDPGDWVVQADLSRPECNGGTTANSSWHGTRVSGILGAVSNNGVGIAGMTWSAWLLPVRVLGKCGGTDLDIIAGMLWAAGIPVSGAPNNPYPARIENMSLGAPGSCLQIYIDTISQLAAKGVLVVVSAGNEGGPVASPANCPGAAGVAGLRHAGTKVGYSSLGPEVAVSSPAGNCVNTAGGPCLYPITTTFNQGTTTPGASDYTDQVNTPNLGTSFSAPIVSGIAGLMLSVNGNLNSIQLIARLKEGSQLFPQTSPGTIPAPLMCHVPTGQTDVQNSECICTLDGQTCGAGMASASGALNAALRPVAAVRVPASVAPGMNVTLDASGSSAACKHTIASYQWASSDQAAHPVTNFTGPSTTVTAPSTGTFTVTLTVTDDAGKTDLATVTVGSATATSSAPATAGTTACLTAISVPSGVTVSVSPPTGSLQAGSGTTETLTATVGNTVNTQVTWQVDTVTGGNATVGTISTSGVYTVPATVPSPATVTITAVSVADPTRSGSATITITAAQGGGGGGGGALDVASLLALALAGLARWPFRRYNSRWAASSQGRCARR
ncbi:MAG: PKD domain-containing protein [Gammaproteobacteria bacterium]|nr:MAG: PKD domain-containing protein [Gammaproteobacteria bacterium]